MTTDVTPHELRTIEFRQAWRGYDQGDVDELLDRVALTLEQLYEQIKLLTDRVESAEAASSAEVDRMLRRTLVLAQQTADAALAEANETATRTVDEAQATATRLVQEAEAEAQELRNNARGAIESEVNELVTLRDELQHHLDELDAFERDYRDRLRALVEADLVRLTERPPIGAPARPAGPDSSSSAPAAESGDEPDVEIDLPKAERPAPAPASQPARTGRPRALDDDEFFASLREAVRDTSPLGPRDDPGGEPALAVTVGDDEGEASGRFGARFRRRG
jgi:cell division initiation protein